MIPPTIPDLVARASGHPFLGKHLTMARGAHGDVALARFTDFELTSAYEPIFDISVHALAQSLSSDAENVDRFGDELGFQAVTQRLDDAPFDMFEAFDRIADDQELVALDRMSREISSVNKISETEAVRQIEQNLAKSPRRGAKTESAPEREKAA